MRLDARLEVNIRSLPKTHPAAVDRPQNLLRLTNSLTGEESHFANPQTGDGPTSVYTPGPTRFHGIRALFRVGAVVGRFAVDSLV